MARVPFNTTIEAGTKEALDAMAESEGTTYGRLVDSMVVFYRDRAKLDIGQVASRLDLVVAGMQRVEDKVLDLLSQGVSVVEAPAAKPPFDAVRDLVAAVPGVSTAGNGFPIRCAHCRENGRGATKWATLCFGCKGGGHTLTPAECPVCCDYGTGAL